MGLFSLITLILTGAATYFSQTRLYKRQCGQEIQNLGAYLSSLMKAQGQDFVNYQNYYMNNFADVNIPFDFHEYTTAENEWNQIFNEEYPDKIFGKDIQFSELSDEAKKAWFIKMHEYWLLTFEQARVDFNIPYTYYLVPKEEVKNVVYMIDGERTEKFENGKSYIFLGDEYYNDPEVYKIEWVTWNTAKPQNDFQVWDNAWGHTYAYYYPLVINGQKMGLVGTEMDVATVNQGIVKNTLLQMLIIAVILLVCVIITLLYIRTSYIKKILFLEKNVSDYSATKDFKIASKIEEEISGKDEIANLGKKISEMILEIENYVQNLFFTKQELNDIRLHAQELGELAIRDSLTGVRNKTAYDKEISYLEEKMKNGLTRFGFVMIDLNNLKLINDTYGHEQGNIAIKKLCKIICDVFIHSPVFRIGGDEFVVILFNSDYKKIDRLVEKFNDALVQASVNLEPWEDISAAIGYALYDEKTDSSINDVFVRADKNMYARKKVMKSIKN